MFNLSNVLKQIILLFFFWSLNLFIWLSIGRKLDWKAVQIRNSCSIRTIRYVIIVSLAYIRIKLFVIRLKLAKDWLLIINSYES